MDERNFEIVVAYLSSINSLLERIAERLEEDSLPYHMSVRDEPSGARSSLTRITEETK